MKEFQVRHGDILICSIGSIPEGAIKRKTNIILEGETTGHAHRISGGAVLEAGEQMYITVPKAGAVTHEEHSKIQLPAGDFIVIRQREYNPYAKVVRNVVD